MILQGGWVNVLSIQARKVVLQRVAAGNRTWMEAPGCALSVFLGSQWQFLLTSCMVEERSAAGGLVTLESVAATWRRSFSFTSFKLGTPCSHLVFQSETLLLQIQSWPGPQALLKLPLPEAWRGAWSRLPVTGPFGFRKISKLTCNQKHPVLATGLLVFSGLGQR